MFKKIEQDFLKPEFSDWWKLKGDQVLSKYDSSGTKLEYFNISDLNFFRSIHTKRFFTIPPDRVSIATITGTGILFPHKDHGFKTVLNYYISADGDTTIFYSPKENAVPYEYPGKEEKNVYHLDQVEEIGRFSAVTGDAYLLDISQIHAVTKHSESTRFFINYLWSKASFEEIAEDLEKVKNGHI